MKVDSTDGDNISISAHPEQLFDSFADTITSSNSEVIYSFTSTNDRTHIVKVSGIVSTPSLVLLKINNTIIEQYWTSLTNKNFEFKFDENINILNGDTLVIEAKVDRFILSTYDTFTSLQGYLI